MNPVVASDKLKRTEVWAEDDESVHWAGAFAVYGGHGTTASSTIVYEIEPGKRLGWHTDATEETQYIIAGDGELHMPGWNVHPRKEMPAQQEDWNEKNRQNPKQHSDIFQLTPHNHGPVGVSSVVNDRPEEAAGAERKEEHERKQPGVAELMRIHERADKTKHEADNGNQTEKS